MPLVTAGPAVGFVVRNDSPDVHEYHVRSFPLGRCARNASWQREQVGDLRLGRAARFSIDPHAWVVKVALFSAEDVGCEIESRFSIDGVDNNWRERVKLTSAYPKIERFPTQPHALTLSVSVIAEKFGRGGEPHGDSIQVQILIENRADQDRVVSILGRRLHCPEGTNFDWIVGPGEAPKELGSGPALLRKRGWIVFSQRIRGKGAVRECRAAFELAELRHTPPVDIYLPPAWVSVQTVETHLKASVRAEYR